MNEKKTSPKRVFISHKAKDRFAVEEIVKKMRLYAGKEIEFYVSGSEYGVDWREKISQYLETSDWYILIYTDPTLDWDWCLYEAGLFEGMNPPSDRHRLICIHRSTMDPPEPLKKFHAVRAVDEELNRFISDMYVSANPNMDEDGIQDIESRIIEAFQMKPDRRYCNDHLELHFETEHADRLRSDRVIADGVLVKSEATGFAIMGLVAKPGGDWTWGELKLRLAENNMNGWTYSLEKAAFLASQSMQCATALDVFYSPFQHKCFRPVIHLIDFVSSDRLMLRLTLVKIPDEDDPRPQNDMARLINAAATYRKLKWGLVERFLADLERLQDDNAKEEKISECLFWLGCVIRKIKSEDISQSINLKKLNDVFPDSAERERVEAGVEETNQLTRKIIEAIENQQVKEVVTHLKDMRPVIKDLQVMVCNRYLEMLRDMD